MKVKLFVILGILIAGILSDATTPGHLNGCARSTLGNTYPTKATDCFSDTSSSIDNCCYMHATLQGISINWCYPLPKTIDLQEVEAATSIYGKAATVECSGFSISVSLIFIALIALLML
jgi:hypothetical protein